MNFVVGTAGHIDHGKSTLIRALTGIDPDRLAEEKRRGMTIDLGFSHLTLPSGRLVGIVDVPGHARFIRNMLAGVHGLDAVLLVVAADEGVMPQTIEHLEIVHLLEIERGVVALTKANLVGVEKDDLRRGHVLVRPGTLPESRRIDAEVVVLAAARRPLRHGSALMLHTGTAEVAARAILLDADEIPAGGRGWVQLYLA